jgi:hypothetical protein
MELAWKVKKWPASRKSKGTWSVKVLLEFIDK